MEHKQSQAAQRQTMGLSLCDRRVAWQMLERVSASDLGNLGWQRTAVPRVSLSLPECTCHWGSACPHPLCLRACPCQPLPAWVGGYPDNLQPWGQSLCGWDRVAQQA